MPTPAAESAASHDGKVAAADQATMVWLVCPPRIASLALALLATTAVAAQAACTAETYTTDRASRDVEARSPAPLSCVPDDRQRARPGRRCARGHDNVHAMADPLDDFIDAAAQALALPVEPAWKPAVRANLEVTLRFACLVDAFALPEDIEPAPVFEA